jgi:hypothetical protein
VVPRTLFEPSLVDNQSAVTLIAAGWVGDYRCYRQMMQTAYEAQAAGAKANAQAAEAAASAASARRHPQLPRQ